VQVYPIFKFQSQVTVIVGNSAQISYSRI